MSKKSFDCVEMMHEAAKRIYEDTKGMTPEQEAAYWRERSKLHEELLNRPRPARSIIEDGGPEEKKKDFDCVEMTHRAQLAHK